MLDPRLKDWWLRESREQGLPGILVDPPRKSKRNWFQRLWYWFFPQKLLLPIIRRTYPSSIKGELFKEFANLPAHDTIYYIQPVGSMDEALDNIRKKHEPK